MSKLPPEFKAKWLEALRSGKYAQTKDHLRTPNGFCCLGVACDLANPEQWFPVEITDEDNNIISVYETSSRSSDMPARGDLPDEVYDALKRYDFDKLYGESYMRVIAMMNDEKGKSFAEIADWIEEHL